VRNHVPACRRRTEPPKQQDVTWQGPDPRIRAALLLVLLCALGAAGLWITGSSNTSEPRAGTSDIATYEAMIARLRNGVPYYQAIGDELRRGHYATREVFNWRTPLLMSTLARVPATISEGALLGLALILFAATLAADATRRWGGLSAAMQLGTFALLAGADLRVMGEPWAGLLIALSTCAYVFGRPAWGVALGLLALFLRELAAPYCVLCMVVALYRRRWREVGAWLVGAALYALYYGWHVTQVWSHRLPDDLAHATSWLEIGGLTSVLSKVHWHGWLVLAPMPLTVLALLIVVASICHAAVPVRVRATTAVYLVFFFVAGKSFDEYWGLIAWPSFALAFGAGVQTIVSAVLLVSGSQAAGSLDADSGGPRTTAMP